MTRQRRALPSTTLPIYVRRTATRVALETVSKEKGSNALPRRRTRCGRKPARCSASLGSTGKSLPKSSANIYHHLHTTLLRQPDECGQYVSNHYTDRLLEAGIEPSVGRVGDSYGNALTETINGLYKAEVIHRRGPWCNPQAVEMATLECVDWPTHQRDRRVN